MDATKAASSYLVGLLCDYAHPDEEAESLFTKPLTFLLHDITPTAVIGLSAVTCMLAGTAALCSAGLRRLPARLP